VTFGCVLPRRLSLEERGRNSGCRNELGEAKMRTAKKKRKEKRRRKRN
jgi:hypothetical protein